MSRITIGGRSFSGNSVVIRDNLIIIDGIVQETGNLSGIVQVEVTGDLASLESEVSVTVNGSVHGSVLAGGSVHCGDVSGSVNAGGSIHCGKVSGNTVAGGSIKVG
jgi:hypothetical protein